MAGRASIVGAAETSVGKVRDHNEDAHFIDPELGIFLVCDGMGGHAAGEVASALAVSVLRHRWSGPAVQDVATRWLAKGTLETRKELLSAIRDGVIQAHNAIIAEAERDKTKGGMGTTLVGALVVGGDIMFAHAGDSRAYLVRDGIAMQLTEDHTLLARLLAAGVDVDTNGEGARFKSMLTNALGIGQECKVSTFVVPVADGDRFLLCSDGITEYLSEAEIGEVLSKMPSPARSAQRLVELALQRGGGDNATALVVRVLEAGETARPAELLRREEESIRACPLWSKLNPQQRLRALRIALPRDHADGERLPAHTLGDRVAWVIIDGVVEENGRDRGPGSLLYPEALLADRPLPDRDGLAVAQGEVRGLALRSDDFRELCEDDPELAEILLEALGSEIALRRPQRRTGKIQVQAADAEAFAPTLQMPPVATEPEAAPANVAAEPAPETIPSVVTIPPKEGDAAPIAAQAKAPSPLSSGPLPSLSPPARIVTPPTGVRVKVPTPSSGVTRVATPAKGVPTRSPPSAYAATPPSGVPFRIATPPRGTPIMTPPKGVPIQIPKKPTPATGVPVKASPSLSERGLIVPHSERAAADAAVDTAWSNITIDDSWDSKPIKSPTVIPPLAPASVPPEAADADRIPRVASSLGEIVVEADEPERWSPRSAPLPPSAVDRQSDPEISIEGLADDADADAPAPEREGESQPDIEIVLPGRAITSNQMSAVSGAIDDDDDVDSDDPRKP